MIGKNHEISKFKAYFTQPENIIRRYLFVYKGMVDEI